MKTQVPAGSRHGLVLFWMFHDLRSSGLTNAVFACKSKRRGDENKVVYRVPVTKTSETRTKQLRFLNRKNLKEDASFIWFCELHFRENFLNRNEERKRLIRFPEPMPTIYTKELVERKPSVLPTRKIKQKEEATRNNISTSCGPWLAQAGASRKRLSSLHIN